MCNCVTENFVIKEGLFGLHVNPFQIFFLQCQLFEVMPFLALFTVRYDFYGLKSHKTCKSERDAIL